MHYDGHFVVFSSYGLFIPHSFFYSFICPCTNKCTQAQNEEDRKQQTFTGLNFYLQKEGDKTTGKPLNSKITLIRKGHEIWGKSY